MKFSKQGNSETFECLLGTYFWHEIIIIENYPFSKCFEYAFKYYFNSVIWFFDFFITKLHVYSFYRFSDDIINLGMCLHARICIRLEVYLNFYHHPFSDELFKGRILFGEPHPHLSGTCSN